MRLESESHDGRDGAGNWGLHACIGVDAVQVLSVNCNSFQPHAAPLFAVTWGPRFVRAARCGLASVAMGVGICNVCTASSRYPRAAVAGAIPKSGRDIGIEDPAGVSPPGGCHSSWRLAPVSESQIGLPAWATVMMVPKPPGWGLGRSVRTCKGEYEPEHEHQLQYQLGNLALRGPTWSRPGET